MKLMLDLEVLLATSSMPTFHKKTQKMLCPAMAIEEEDRFLVQIDCVVILAVSIHLRRGNRFVSTKLRKQFLIKWVQETDHPGHPTIHKLNKSPIWRVVVVVQRSRVLLRGALRDRKKQQQP